MVLFAGLLPPNFFLIDKLNVAHNKVIRYLTYSKPCSRAWPLYCQLKVLPLKLLIQIEWGKTMYRFQACTLPPVFNEYFSKPGHNHNTRYSSNNNFEVFRAQSAKERSLLRFIGPKVWSEVPLTIKKCPTVKSFISMYRTHLLSDFDGNIN